MGPDSPASDEIQRFEEQYRRQAESLVFARLADAYRKAGEPERALPVLEDGLLRHPDYPSGHIVMARVLRDLGRVDEALHSFRRVLELDGANLVAIRELAGLADERGEVGEARHWYERLAQIDSADPEVRRRLAELEAAVTEPAAADAADAQGEASAEMTEATPYEEGPSAWWDDSAADLATAVAGVHADGEDESDAAHEEASDKDMRPEDEVVEAILNGAVPQTVRAEDTWWYEEVSESEEPAPSRDADLLTRTMADLYAEQGLRREAAEIYQELLKDAPGDPELLARLEALRAEEPPAVTVGEEEEEPEAGDGAPWRETSESDAVAGPVPLGRPKGTPWLEELRRLLRTGEEHAGSFPEVESLRTSPGLSAGAEADAPGETPVDGGAASVEAGAAEGAPSDETGRFLRDWIQGLEADA
jgi:tetratricopeptide (TPR) repeat protein